MNAACRKAIRDAIALLAIIAPAWTHSADLEVLNDSKGSIPVAIYFSHLLSGVDQPGVLEGVRFPLRSRLTPGTLGAVSAETKVFDARWMGQPIFVIGTDKVSTDWLEKNMVSLFKLGAAGLVIAADSEASFKKMQTLAGHLSLAPVTDGWLEHRLTAARIAHFPLLIMSDGSVTSALSQESVK